MTVSILYIDPVAGASGDMFLGALVDLGVDFGWLRDTLRQLEVPGFDLAYRTTTRHAIAASKVDVIVKDMPHPHRHLGDLLEIVSRGNLPEAVRDTSSAALRLLAEAEARAHRMPVEEVHLHEVGGLDCLVDIVGTALGVHSLGVDHVVSGPVSLGAGFQKCAHGVMPVPVPGTLAVLEGFPVRRTQIPCEMTTPTGAALIATLSRPSPPSLVMTVRRTGYGAGTRDTPEIANLLRLMIAEADAKSLVDAAGPGPRLQQHDHPHHHHHHDHPHDHEH